jgi:hypothetical protein
MAEDNTIDLGRVFMTRGVYDKSMENERFAAFCWKSLSRFMNKDWGDLDEEDRKRNNEAIETGARIFAAYEHAEFPKIWIILEADRSATTILFPEEY